MEATVTQNAEQGYKATATVEVSNTVATAAIGLLTLIVTKAFELADKSEKRSDERHQLHLERERFELERSKTRAAREDAEARVDKASR